MLVELPNVSQPVNEPPRRWFKSAGLELVVWCDPTGGPMGFQLCYSKGCSAFAVTWLPERGLSHTVVDEGESIGGRFKSSPILIPTRTKFPADQVANRFKQESDSLPTLFTQFVLEKLLQHPIGGSRAAE